MSLITSGMVGNGGFAAYLAQYSSVYTNFRGRNPKGAEYARAIDRAC